MVALDAQGDRLDMYEVVNYVVGQDGEIDTVPVGLYNSTLQQYIAYGRTVVWPGKTMEVPVDYAVDYVDPFFRICSEHGEISNCTEHVTCIHV